MQSQNDLAVNLMNLFDANSYKRFEEGYFTNQPKMSGYFYVFKNIKDPKLCLIVNESDLHYSTQRTQIGDYIFMVYNTSSLEEFITDLSTKYLPSMLETISQVTDTKVTRNLPYGYYYDESGDIKIDLKKANEVKKIYDRYQETGSVRQIAKEMRTNFSHIRDILHDNEEYMQMTEKILPITTLKKVNEILAQNVKSGYRAKETITDKIKDIRSRIKTKIKMKQKEQQAKQ